MRAFRNDKKTLINKVVSAILFNFVLVRKHIVQFNISTYVQTGAWGAKVGIHPGRKKPAITLLFTYKVGDGDLMPGSTFEPLEAFAPQKVTHMLCNGQS